MRVGIIAFTTNGCRTAKAIAGAFADGEVELFAKSTSDELDLKHVDVSMRAWTEQAFEDYDVIVCGNLGRTGFKRLMLGSVSEKLVRFAHCPVYVARVKTE